MKTDQTSALPYSTVETFGEALLRFQGSEHPAVLCEDRTLTYAGLCARGQVIAGNLIRMGVKKGDRIALDLKRTETFFCMLLGASLAGGIVVVISPAWSMEHRAHVLSDAEPAAVVDDALAGRLMESAHAAGDPVQLPAVCGEDPFLLCYTSGSTGRPKGARTCHALLVQSSFPTEDDSCIQFLVSHCERFLVDGNLAFLYLLHAAFYALCNEKTLVLATEEEIASPALLTRCIRERQVDALFRTPSRMIFELTDPGFARAMEPVRFLCLAGERITGHAVHQILPHMKNAVIFLDFGASEMGVIENHIWEEGNESSMLGVLKEYRLHVLDPEGHACAAGVPGELCIGGMGGRLGGYWRDAELNREKYEVHPLFGRIFHTGDSARIGDDGIIRVEGRIDGMIKLHGQRIDPQMPEKAVLSFPGIRQAAIVLHAEGEEQTLVCYYCRASSAEGERVEEGAIRRFLVEKLPYYMVPAVFVELEKMPMNSNGKLDRRELGARALRKSASCAYAPPETEEEALLCRLFQEVLKLQDMPGAENSFFELGGNSLTGMRLLDALHRQGYKLEMRLLFAAPSPRLLAPCLQKEDAGSKSAAGGHALPPLPAMTAAQRMAVENAGLEDQVEWICPVSDLMAEALKEGDPWMMPVFLPVTLTDGKEVCRERFQEMARAHSALRSVFLFPEGERPIQAVLKTASPQFFYADRSFEKEEGELLSEGQRRYLGRVMLYLEGQQLSLSRDILIVAGLLRLSEEKGLILLYFSHYLMDAQGMRNFAGELLGEKPIRPDTDSLKKRARRLLYADRQAALLYWRGLLKRLPGHLSVFPAPDVETQAGYVQGPGSVLYLPLNRQGLFESFSEYCERQNTGYAAAIHLCFGRALCAVLGAETCAFWTTVNGRGVGEQDLIGMFRLSVPFFFEKDMTVHDCQQQLLMAQEHGWVFLVDEAHLLPVAQQNEVNLNVVTVDQGSGTGQLRQLFSSDVLDAQSLKRHRDMEYERLLFCRIFQTGEPPVCAYAQNRFDAAAVRRLRKFFLKEMADQMHAGDE